MFIIEEDGRISGYQPLFMRPSNLIFDDKMFQQFLNNR